MDRGRPPLRQPPDGSRPDRRNRGAIDRAGDKRNAARRTIGRRGCCRHRGARTGSRAAAARARGAAHASPDAQTSCEAEARSCEAAPAAQKAQPKAAPKAPPAKNRPARPTGRLDGIAEGLSKSQPKSPASKGAPAAATAAEVRRSIDVSIKSAVAPRWNGCRISGVDVDQLKTVVKFRLTQSGALAGFTSVTTTGENDSNKFQIQRHQECAKRAVELAAPFDLPEENYSFWQNYTLDFIKR